MQHLRVSEDSHRSVMLVNISIFLILPMIVYWPQHHSVIIWFRSCILDVVSHSASLWRCLWFWLCVLLCSSLLWLICSMLMPWVLSFHLHPAMTLLQGSHCCRQLGKMCCFLIVLFFRVVPRVVFNTVLGLQEMAASSISLRFCETSQGHRSFIRIFSDNCWRLISLTKQNGPVKIAQGGSSGVPFLSMVRLLSGFIMLRFRLKFLVLSGACNVDSFLFCSLKHF